MGLIAIMSMKKMIQAQEPPNDDSAYQDFLNRLEPIWDDHVVGAPVRLRDPKTGATYDLIGNT
jgi:hypothetical protein